MTNTSNKPSFADIMQVAKDLGADAGKGRDTQIKFMLKAVEGGYHGILDPTANKHGPEIDDATKLSEAYVLGQKSATIFDAKAPNQRKLISCVRQVIKLGGWTKGGNGEPLATVNNLMTMRQNMKKVPADAKRLDDATNTLMKYARAQLKSDTLIDDAQLKEFCYKPGKNLLTSEAIIEGITKQLDKLISGAAQQGTAQDNSKEIINARQELRNRLSAIAKARAAAKGPNPQVQV